MFYGVCFLHLLHMSSFAVSFIWPQNFLIGFVVAFPQLRWVLCVCHLRLLIAVNCHCYGYSVIVIFFLCDLTFLLTFMPSVLWHCWLDIGKSIWHVKKLSVDMIVRLFVWSEVQVVCIWSSWCHCIPKPHNLLPHLNPDWFYLSGTGFLEKRLLSGCSSSSSVILLLLKSCLFVLLISMGMCFLYSLIFNSLYSHSYCSYLYFNITSTITILPM